MILIAVHTAHAHVTMQLIFSFVTYVCIQILARCIMCDNIYIYIYSIVKLDQGSEIT